MATVLDLFNREVIGHAMASHMRADLVCAAVDLAHSHGLVHADALFHSDRGAQYTSAQFRATLVQLEVRSSMGQVGSASITRSPNRSSPASKPKSGPKSGPAAPRPGAPCSPTSPTTNGADCTPPSTATSHTRPGPDTVNKLSQQHEARCPAQGGNPSAVWTDAPDQVFGPGWRGLDQRAGRGTHWTNATRALDLTCSRAGAIRKAGGLTLPPACTWR